jgi:hypothetical protein
MPALEFGVDLIHQRPFLKALCANAELENRAWSRPHPQGRRL